MSGGVIKKTKRVSFDKQVSIHEYSNDRNEDDEAQDKTEDEAQNKADDAARARLAFPRERRGAHGGAAAQHVAAPRPDEAEYKDDKCKRKKFVRKRIYKLCDDDTDDDDGGHGGESTTSHTPKIARQQGAQDNLEVYHKDDEVEVIAPYGDNFQYKGRRGTVISDGEVPSPLPYYYHVSLPEHTLVIHRLDIRKPGDAGDQVIWFSKEEEVEVIATDGVHLQYQGSRGTVISDGELEGIDSYYQVRLPAKKIFISSNMLKKPEKCLIEIDD